jgi:hypothetical protein
MSEEIPCPCCGFLVALDEVFKVCTKCKKEKPLSDFYKTSRPPAKAFDRASQCKECVKRQIRQYREENSLELNRKRRESRRRKK